MKISKDVIWTEEFLQLSNLPLPISVNAFANKTTKKGKYFKTKERQRHDYDWEVWYYANGGGPMAKKMRETLFGEDHGKFLDRVSGKIIFVEYFWKKAWLTKKGQLRKQDFSNFIKAPEDQIAGLLKVNDCHFGNFRTHLFHSEEDECFKIKIWKPFPIPGMI